MRISIPALLLSVLPLGSLAAQSLQLTSPASGTESWHSDNAASLQCSDHGEHNDDDHGYRLCKQVDRRPATVSR